VPPYDRVQTTQRIFDAAVVEFAAEGIAGARVDRIAANADSNKALIYSYFGNKEQLFATVLQSRLTDLAEAVELDPTQVHEYVGDLFDFMTANPDVLRLVQHETCHFALDAVPHRDTRKAHYDGKVAAVSGAQGSGDVDPTLDPNFVVMTLFSLVSWFVAAPQITDMVVGNPDDTDRRARYRAHLVEMSRRMLTPRSI
jgi:AcrR family transcriptional regulator